MPKRQVFAILGNASHVRWPMQSLTSYYVQRETSKGMDMKTFKTFRAAIVALTCLGVVVPRGVMAAETVIVDGVPVSQTVENLELQKGMLIGGLVDASGKGVEDAPVVIGQNGKPVAELRTDSEGRFAAKGLKPGVYQVVSHGKVTTHRVWEEGKAPAEAKRGVIHSVDPQVARGASNGGLLGILANPLVLALIIAAAIAIPLALDDDDDAS